MNRPVSHRRCRFLPALALALCMAGAFAPAAAFAQGAAQDVSQYAHTSWSAREGYSLGAVFAIVQTPDGYLWLGGENGLYRFNGVDFTRWQPPDGKPLPAQPYSLLVSRDGTLWIGTFHGLVSWNGASVTRYPELEKQFVTSLLEDRDGTVWAGALSPGRLCAIRGAAVQCHGEHGEFGGNVWSLAEDGDGVLWAVAETGLWRWKPGAPRKYEQPGVQLGDLTTTSDGRLLIGVRGGGLRHFSNDRIVDYPLRSAGPTGARLADEQITSNKLLRDREGGLWIGTDGRGIIHVTAGKAHTFARVDGLSGNVACAFLQDREGNIWYASSAGLDRFRAQAVANLSARQGLTSESVRSVVATADGSIWLATSDGVTRFTAGLATTFGGESGLPDSGAKALWADMRGRVWVTSTSGLGYFKGNHYVAVPGLPSKEVFSLAGDAMGDLWISGYEGLWHVRGERIVETFPVETLGRTEAPRVVLPDRGGLWMAFWNGGGLRFFQGGKVRTVYTTADGLGAGRVTGLRMDAEGAVWAVTDAGGLSRIKDGHIATLTTANGLPCDAAHWSIEDAHRALWIHTKCGLVRITRDEVEKWLGDPRHQVANRIWTASDGAAPTTVATPHYNPPVARAADGKLWYVAEDGVKVVDPDYLPINTLAPPVQIERLVADHQEYPTGSGARLPPLTRDVTVEFAALSFVDPHNIRFRYRLHGYDEDWREVVDRRQVSYGNLSPGRYRFEVRAANSSGVWNPAAAQLEFSIRPAIYQTSWFRLAAVLLGAGAIWGVLHLRVRQLRREERRLRAVIEGIPAMAFSVRADGSPDLVNRRWLDYAGIPAGAEELNSWRSTLHPDDAPTLLERWCASLASGAPFEGEARHRSATGEYRWFQMRAVPLRDAQGRILKWYGTLTDIEERKHAEEEREQLRRLEAQLAHTNRLSMLGELTASLAHEINQPIGAVVASAGAGLRWLDRDPPALERVREAILRIKDDGNRAADIVAGLKAFYKKDAPATYAPLDVNDVVREMLILLQRESTRHAVRMRTDLASHLPRVRAARVQLQQVLMNLMVNAFEAMGKAGGDVLVSTHARGGEVVVSVSDTGVGIAPDQLDQIFSAFMTTKVTGTGMGLAISRTIVESLHGRIWAESNAGRGATFQFTLPALP